MEKELLNNEAGIDESVLREIIHRADFPSERLLLNLLNKDKILRDIDGMYYQGVCFLKCLYHYSGGWMHVPGDYLIKAWDCGISISGKWCHRQQEYPAYFAYLLGHELGHAHICCSGTGLHIHCSLVDSHLPEFSSKRQQYEYPHEIRFDQFGICIAEQIYSREKLHGEIRALMEKPDCDDHEHLESMLNLPGTTDLSNIRNELIELTMSFKTKLIKSWEKERDCNPDSLEHKVKDFESFFEKS